MTGNLSQVQLFTCACNIIQVPRDLNRPPNGKQLKSGTQRFSLSRVPAGFGKCIFNVGKLFNETNFSPHNVKLTALVGHPPLAKTITFHQKLLLATSLSLSIHSRFQITLVIKWRSICMHKNILCCWNVYFHI